MRSNRSRHPGVVSGRLLADPVLWAGSDEPIHQGAVDPANPPRQITSGIDPLDCHEISTPVVTSTGALTPTMRRAYVGGYN